MTSVHHFKVLSVLTCAQLVESDEESAVSYSEGQSRPTSCISMKILMKFEDSVRTIALECTCVLIVPARIG